MANTGRHCIRYKNVQTGGVSRRVCAKYGDVSEDVEHSGMFGDLGRFVPKALTGSTDALVGVGIGLAGVAGLKLLLGNLPANVTNMIPSPVYKALPAIGGALAGVVSYSVSKNKSYALGALGAGVALNAWDLLSAQFPSLGVLTTYSIPGYGRYGMLQPEVDRAGGAGLQGGYAALIDDPRPGMGDLAMMSMSGGDEGEGP
jgi:hypothetical protein